MAIERENCLVSSGMMNCWFTRFHAYEANQCQCWEVLVTSYCFADWFSVKCIIRGDCCH